MLLITIRPTDSTGIEWFKLSKLPLIISCCRGMASTRSQPVKVEGFQELMGGDAKSKHDAEEQKLTSPSK